MSSKKVGKLIIDLLPVASMLVEQIIKLVQSISDAKGDEDIPDEAVEAAKQFAKDMQKKLDESIAKADDVDEGGGI